MSILSPRSAENRIARRTVAESGLSTCRNPDRDIHGSHSQESYRNEHTPSGRRGEEIRGDCSVIPVGCSFLHLIGYLEMLMPKPE